MHATQLYIDDWDIDGRLSQFGATRPEFYQVVREVIGARADAVENDPVTAAGQFAYIHGTRNLRALFGAKGWIRDRRDNIESIRDPGSRLKIVYQSVDRACDELRNPQAISGKGSGAERAIGHVQESLFSDAEFAALGRRSLTLPPSGMWFFCVSVDGDDVRAELSKASRVSGGNFDAFDERIFIIRKGEWETLRIEKDDDSDLVELEPSIRRK